MTIAWDPTELKWLQENPAFWQRPATIKEFLGEHYLNIEDKVREGVKEALIDIFGVNVQTNRIARVRRAMFTGAIGIGKTTFASIALPYMVHWVMCLDDPQDYFDLLPGSRIAFMQMSTSEDQAREVLFGDIKARIQYSPWFTENAQTDPSFKNQIRFPSKDIWILPGDSSETTFEGYNILGGILDEADSHKITKDKDYAEVGYDTIHGRIDSRFQDRGLLIVIGQMKKGNGFAKKKFDELSSDSEAHVAKMTIWESLGWHKFLKPDGSRNSFWYDTRRKQIVPAQLVPALQNSNLMEIPVVYQKNFEVNPEKALRDLAGIPPATGDPFISLVHKIEEATDRWNERNRDDYTGAIIGSPVDSSCTNPRFRDWFVAPNSLMRVAHIDIAVSAEGDALGLAMGHVSHLENIDGEEKPYIIIDFLMRIRATPGTEIILGDVRRILYELRDDRNFRLKLVSMDGFQSTDTRQQLKKRRFQSQYLSVDKSKLPYEDLREAIYEDRIEFPPYETQVMPGDVRFINILYKELTELSDDGKKIDHPKGGSKDVADAVAGVVTTLMGDRKYRRGVRSPRTLGTNDDLTREPGVTSFGPPTSMAQGLGPHAPIPNMPSLSSMEPLIPPRLRTQRGE